MTSFFSKTLLIALVLSVAACSSTPVRRSVKETWNDSLTASKIRYKMMRDSEVSKSRMHVEVFRGQVTLTGRSMTDAEKVRAEALAKSVRRVIGVENYVHVVGGSDTAVAKAPVTGVPPVAVSPKAGVAPAPAIQEKTLVTEKIKVKVEEDDAIATLPTIRESTGRPAATVSAPVVASRKGADSKIVTSAAKNSKPVVGKAKKPETKPAAVVVRKAPSPVTTVKAPAPVVAPVDVPAVAQSAVKAASPAPVQSTVPAAKVVGQSKTGLPWDGEVYEDDATRVSAPAKSATAARTPVAATTPVSTPPPAVSPAPATGDDLAIEAAQELEKLRQKK